MTKCELHNDLKGSSSLLSSAAKRKSAVKLDGGRQEEEATGQAKQSTGREEKTRRALFPRPVP